MKVFTLTASILAMSVASTAIGADKLYFRVSKSTPAGCDLRPSPTKKNAAATVGELIVSSWPICSVPVIETTESFSISSDREGGVNISVAPGRAVYFAESRGVKIFKFLDQVYLPSGESSTSDSRSIVLAVPTDGQESGEMKAGIEWRLHEDREGIEYFQLGKLEKPIAYKEVEAGGAPATYHGFGQTLSYLGLSGGKIRFSYDEFKDSYARPAFKQEVELDYLPGQEYAYKSARFVVHEATVQSIRYSVLSNFGVVK